MLVDMALDEILRSASQEKISDIHFDSRQNGLCIRYRRDGLLETVRTVAPEEGQQMINRIKVMSGLDISEKRLPQDGRLQWQDGTYEMTMRISTLPSMYGETVVCRIMGNEGSHKTLMELGMKEELFERVSHILERPYGLFLVSGPTGSGKSATLYSILRMIAREDSKLICLEDPVEASIEGAIQVGINDKIGLSFANGLRSVLRQDPDTIMIGEIRDQETARLAIQAALTGHKVFSTIHTNTAAGVVGRLVDMGVEPYLVEATLLGSLSQRLVRRYNQEAQAYAGRFAIYEYFEPPRNQAFIGKEEDWVVTHLEEAMAEAIKAGLTTKEEGMRLGLGGCL